MKEIRCYVFYKILIWFLIYTRLHSNEVPWAYMSCIVENVISETNESEKSDRETLMKLLFEPEYGIEPLWITSIRIMRHSEQLCCIKPF